jgi:uncharacterized membrane protein YqhA
MRGAIERLRYLMVPVCLVMAGATAMVIVWGTAKTVSLAERLLQESGWKRDALVGELLEILDLFLIGAVLVIVTVALWQIFVDDLSLPPSLEVTSLAALKRKISDLLLIVIAVQFAKQFLSGVRGLDLLYAGASVALVGAVLVAFARAPANEVVDGSPTDRDGPDSGS